MKKRNYRVWFWLLFVIAVAYVLSPIDIIPDIVPLFGVLDDATLIGVASYFLGKNRMIKVKK